jgi:uncharacterized membrane protein YeaQ/YmgE (transglycosylase-associated protein family)
VIVGSIGAVCFGVVVGWIAYRTLRRTSDRVKISDLATVVGAVGGGAVTTAFGTPDLFGWYSIGLAVGFFGYLVLALTKLRNVDWLGDD